MSEMEAIEMEEVEVTETTDTDVPEKGKSGLGMLINKKNIGIVVGAGTAIYAGAKVVGKFFNKKGIEVEFNLPVRFKRKVTPEPEPETKPESIPVEPEIIEAETE